MLAGLVLPVTLTTQAGAVHLRRARPDDLAALVRLLADDPISTSRGDVADPADDGIYQAALEGVLHDAANDLLVADDGAGVLVATCQLTLTPGMTRRGSTRLDVEAVRVAGSLRSSGIGSALMRWIVDDAAPGLGASLVQLTSDAARVDAHRFYRRLGFADSHVGFKLSIPRR